MGRRARRLVGGGAPANAALALRTSGVAVTPELREHVLSRMERRLGKFARHIDRVTVRFEDVNGPRGGVDTVCRIKVVLTGLETILVEELAPEPFEAVNRADDRVERAVKHALRRARGRGRIATSRRAAALEEPVRATHAPARAARPKPVSRNFKRRTRKATAALEVSAQARPSRKSTRKSANRARQGNKLSRRQVRRVSSPKARQARSKRR